MRKNEIYTLDDNLDYLVLSSFTMDGIEYVYLVEVDKQSNIICGKIINGELIMITDPTELNRFMLKVSEDL